MQIRRSYLALFTTLLAASVLTIVEPVSAVELEVQSNLVPVDFAGDAWTNFNAWKSIPRYQADPVGDAASLEGNDCYYTQVAHNADWFFLAYSNNDSFAGDRQYTYFDTDSDVDTGFGGTGGTLAVGAEYFLTAAGPTPITSSGLTGIIPSTIAAIGSSWLP